MKGLYGRLLRVDLSSGTHGVYEIPEAWQSALIGGRALGARILHDELSGAAPGFSPEKPLL